MRSLLISIARELKLIARDSIALYMVIAPAALALVFLMVFGSVQGASVAYVVDRSLPAELTSKLEAVADIEYAEDDESLIARVSGADSVAGVSMKDGRIVLLVEGNEDPGFAESRRSLVSAALGAEAVEYTSEAVDAQRSLAYTISMTCVFLLALFIGGATLGLNGVTERELGVIRAVSISPMSLGGYTLSKLIPALLLGLVGVSACALILGRADALLPFLLLALSSALVSGIILFLIISFSDNQVAAVGVLKITMPVFLILGVSAVFVPESWLGLYHAIPMYWQYAAFDAIIDGRAAAFPLLMIPATSIPWFAAVMIIFSKRVRMKAWR